VVLVVTIARAAGTLQSVQRTRLHLHFTRNLSHFIGQNLWFFAITVAPLAQVFALEFSSPIWAMFLAVIVLGEKLTKLRLSMAFIGFLGVLIVTEPWRASIGPGVIAAAVAAIGFAGSAVFTRLLTRAESITSIMFWLTTMQAVFGLICAGYDGDIALPSLPSLPGVATIAVGGLVAHFCLTRALSLAPAAVIMPVDFARLPIIIAVGALLYAEPFSATVVIGAALIFGANYVNIAAEHRLNRRA
jgi:drug/metabolite transporter (DMT)-like permease